MKRELKFFIDLFIENCETKSKDEQKEDFLKLIRGSYYKKIGDNFQFLVLKKDDKYSFSYIDLTTRKPICSITTGMTEIKSAFDFLLSF